MWGLPPINYCGRSPFFAAGAEMPGGFSQIFFEGELVFLRDINKSEAKYLRRNGGSKYVKTIGKQAKSKKKAFCVIESGAAIALLNKYWKTECRVIYDSAKDGGKS